MSKKISKWVLISIILAVLLISLLVYTGVKSYKTLRESERNEIFLQGYQSAVVQLMQSGANCTPVNVYIQNETMQFVDVSCLSATK